MEIRQATDHDTAAIREVARRSLEASYSHALSEEAIEHAVEEWYNDETLSENLADVDRLYIVADDDGEVVAFSESEFVDAEEAAGEILWLHVHPERRDAGIGTHLFDHTEDVLQDMGADYLAGRVLAENEDGNSFYQHHSYEFARERPVTISGESHVEREYRKFWRDDVVVDALEAITGPDGETLYVAHDETHRGSLGSFYAAYRDTDRETKYGWYCSNCETLDNAMDPMGRLECNQCGNKRRPTRWDAAYL